MPVIRTPTRPTHDLGPTRFTALATPSRGSTKMAVWRVEIEPDTPPTPHSMSNEEVFVVLGGRAMVRIGDGRLDIAELGDAVVIPAATRFEISPAGPAPLEMVCCTPVGAQARTDDGTEFTPPWSQ